MWGVSMTALIDSSVYLAWLYMLFNPPNAKTTFTTMTQIFLKNI